MKGTHFAGRSDMPLGLKVMLGGVLAVAMLGGLYLIAVRGEAILADLSAIAALICG